MASFTAIVVLLLFLLQVVFLPDIYKAIKLSEIKDAASDVRSLAKKPLSLEENAMKVAESKNVCIIGYRIERNGGATLLLSCEATVNCVIHRLNVSEIVEFYGKARANGGSAISYYIFDPKSDSYVNAANGNDYEGSEALIYSFIVKDARGNDMIFVLNSHVSPVDATVKTLNFLIVIIGGVMIAMSLILTLILSRSIAKPITDISKSAKRLAVGDYSASFKGGSYREVNDLAASLTYASAELSKTDRLRSELIANTSHDLRTPLTMIAGYAEMMRDIPGENTPENAQIIIDESKRLTSLVNDMLDISKLESGNSPLNVTSFNVTEAISSELLRYQELCRREGYRIDFTYDAKVTVSTDRQKLLQALFNLVNNALTYTGDDKSVYVIQNVLQHGDESYIRLSVKDTGMGIPEDKLDIIWDRYYKIDSPHKRSSYGSGLGLSIVRRTVELLDGRCGVLSSNGNGSIFWIEIPLEH